MSDIKELREKISSIDEKLQRLLQERMETVQAIGTYKAANHLPVTDPAREQKVLQQGLENFREDLKPGYLRLQHTLFDISKDLQNHIAGTGNAFLNDSSDSSDYIDAAFNASKAASGDPDPSTINATLGTLYGEDGKLAALKSVFDVFDKVDNRRKAGYAERINGNESFNNAVYDWVNRLDNIHLPHTVTAAPGGTGALHLIFAGCLNPYETVLIPDIGWGSYNTMASLYKVNVARYPLVTDGQPDLEGMMKVAREIMNRQHKLVIIINDPCQNPTGLCYGRDNWQKLISFFNELSQQGPVIIVDDIAYFDYASDYEHVTDYMSCFNDITDNVMVAIAFSCSKSFSAYGMRLGALIALARHQEAVDEAANAFIRYARGTWSNVNNGLMDTVAEVLTHHREEYLAEKKQYISYLHARAGLFISQAEECGLPLYPYSEGFFLTIPLGDPHKLSLYHQKLMENHIYTVKFSKGIRIAVCSLTMKTADGLAPRMKKILDEVN